MQIGDVGRLRGLWGRITEDANDDPGLFVGLDESDPES